MPVYKIHNPYLGISTTVRVLNFDGRSLTGTYPLPEDTRAYVANATFNGVPLNSTCHLDFHVFRKGGELVLGMTTADGYDNKGGCRGQNILKRTTPYGCEE